jgi:hypothetical protein
MEPIDEARTVARALRAIAHDPRIAELAAARELEKREPEHALGLIDGLVQLARSDPTLRPTVGAVMAALATEPFRARREQIETLARQKGNAGVQALLSGAPPKQEFDLDVARKNDARSFSQTLGFLKTRARLTKNLDELARLVQLSDPSVVRNALLNPRLTEDGVVRIAARRPARPEPLIEIWRSPRWSQLARVRRALAMNPYLPPEIGTKILPLLTASDLKQIAGDGGLHEDLRALAKRLLADSA